MLGLISYNVEAAFCNPLLIILKQAADAHNIAAANGILEDDQVMEPREALLFEPLELHTGPTH